jgi:hypothetical protein
MSPLVVSFVIFLFWFSLGLIFLALDLMYPKLYYMPILGRQVSATWPCFILAGYNAFRVLMHWAYKRRKVSDGMYEQTLRNKRRLPERDRPEEPPDPNFQFTDAPKDEPR